jgi:hypothetical protein
VTSARLSGVASAGAVSSITATNSNFSGGVTLAYDATTGGYTVNDGSSSQSFMPINKSVANSNAVVSVYNVSGTGGRTEQLVLFNPGSGNTTLALTYVSYGAWQTVSGTTSVNFDQRYFVYGIRQGANQPSTGSASYVTTVDGFWSTTTGLYALGGSATFNANFSNLTVSTNLNLTGTNIENSNSKSLGIFNGTGTIASLGGAFNGTFAHQGTDADGNVYSGAFNGAFFGPTGSEVGYTFRLTGPNGAAVGAVVGKAQ